MKENSWGEAWNHCPFFPEVGRVLSITPMAVFLHQVLTQEPVMLLK